MELFVDSLAILHRGQMIASGTLSEVENILGCEPSLIVAGKGWCPPSANSFGRNVSLEKSDAWPDEDWRIILRKRGGWSSDEKHIVLKSIEEAGGEINLLQTVLPTLEDMLAAATGESADTVGLEVGDDSMIPLRKWEASEDE